MAASTIELNRIRRPPPLAAVRFFTEEQPPTSPEDLFQQSQSYEDDQLLGIQPPWRRELFQLLEQATSSGTAFFLHIFLTFLIVFSALVTIMETVPAVHSISTRVWFGVETTVVVLFTMEYIARCLAWSSTWTSLFYWVICESISLISRTVSHKLLAFYGVIDLLSVLPYYLELLLQQDTVSLKTIFLFGTNLTISVCIFPILYSAHVPSITRLQAIPLQSHDFTVCYALFFFYFSLC